MAGREKRGAKSRWMKAVAAACTCLSVLRGSLPLPISYSDKRNRYSVPPVRLRVPAGAVQLAEGARRMRKQCRVNHMQSRNTVFPPLIFANLTVIEKQMDCAVDDLPCLGWASRTIAAPDNIGDLDLFLGLLFISGYQRLMVIYTKPGPSL